jgi:hypothetical protein
MLFSARQKTTSPETISQGLFCKDPAVRQLSLVVCGYLLFTVCLLLEKEKEHIGDEQQNDRPNDVAQLASFFHVVYENMTQHTLYHQQHTNDQVGIVCRTHQKGYHQ